MDLDSNELLKLRQKWYSDPLTLLEMVKCMNKREVCFLEGKTEMPLLTKNASPVRCVKAYALDYLLKNFEAFDFINKPYNIYCSVALFENFPVFSFAPNIRSGQQDAFFHGVGFDLCFKGYDFVLDLDSKTDLSIAYADAKKVKIVFDEFKLKYSVKFSGKQGFHFVIKDKDFFPDTLTTKEKVSLAEMVAKGLKIVENISSIDLSIYQSTRILKCPYSLEGFNVALPLSDEQFNAWTIESMRIDEVYNKVVLKERGLLERSGGDSKEFIDCYVLFD